VSTMPETLATQPWNNWPVMVFAGQRDTRIHTGEDYATQSLASIFTMPPADKGKGAGLAFIPSTYADYDGREHAAQRENGAFVALTGDIDHGNHALNVVRDLVRTFAGEHAWLIYSSAHARPGDMRWRIILPLVKALAFPEWHDAQNAFYDFMEAHGVEMDRALARAAQPVYAPNVPQAHASSGTALRGEDGKPLYFKRASSGLDKPGLPLDSGLVAAGLLAIRHKRAEDDKERDRIRQEAEKRRASRPRVEGASLIDDFNASNSVATMLEICGYTQSPRHPEDWRSPQQTGDTYATRVIGSKWVSLSQSDAASGLGTKCAAGCYGDAYDLELHYRHGGDHKAAFRAIGAEQRGNVIRPEQFNPPAWMNEIPPYDDAPDWGEPDLETGVDHSTSQADAPVVEDLPIFHPADWQGQNPPERVWRWDGFIPDGQATLLTGAGAAGKSLATQQMSTCIALGLPFLGAPVRQCNALYITCEDDLDELHRRQEAICAMLGVPMEATRGKLFLLSLQGMIGNELAMFDHDGSMTIAPRFGQIERACLDLDVHHVTIDNTAHTFAGNENDRHQVAAFVNLNNKLAQSISGSVVMVGHPNKAGDSYSGSTAWENQVRSRLYLEIPKNGDEGTPIDPDMRVLRNEKANYSQRGAEVHFYWLRGAFVLEEEMPEGTDKDNRENAQAAFENKVFMGLLETLTRQRRQVSHAPNVGTYAPRVMAGMPEAKGLNKAQLARAMERLFLLDKIVASAPLWIGKDRHPVLGLAIKSECGT